MTVLDVSRSLLREAYDLVLARWPEVILPGVKTFHLGGACNMRGLNETHEPIDAWALQSDVDGPIGGIISAVEHYLYTCIHDALRNMTCLEKADIDFEAFVSRFDGHPGYRVID